MLGTETTSWLGIYKSTPGRRAFACSQIETAANEFPEIAAMAKTVRTYDEGVVRLQQAWLSTREDDAGSEANVAAVVADQNLDRWIGSTTRTLDELAKLGNERGHAAKRIRRKHFGAGAEALTTLPFPDANQAVKVIVEDLAGDSAPDVALAGIGDHVVELTQARSSLDAAMRKQGAARLVSFDEVRTADRQGQALFSDLIVAVLHHTAPADRRAARGKLLLPIEVQNDALRELHRSRRRITDVDPTTGVVVDDATSGTNPPPAPNPPQPGTPE